MAMAVAARPHVVDAGMERRTALMAAAAEGSVDVLARLLERVVAHLCFEDGARGTQAIQGDHEVIPGLVRGHLGPLEERGSERPARCRTSPARACCFELSTGALGFSAPHEVYKASANKSSPSKVFERAEWLLAVHAHRTHLTRGACSVCCACARI